MGEADERIQLFAGGAGVDGFSGEIDAVAEISGAAGGDESCGRVGEDDFAVRAVLPVEKRAAKNLVDDFGVVSGVATCVSVRGRTVKAKIFGRKFVSANGAAAQFGDVSFGAERNLVEAVSAVNDECAFDSELRERAGEKVGVIRSGNAYHLRGGSRGIGERAEKVENRANAESVPRGNRMFHRRMNCGRKKKPDADLFDGLANALGRLFDDDAELFEHVGRASARACGAIAVFGDAHACARDDESRGGGNVESVAAVAAGAAGVDEHFVGMPAAVGENLHGTAAHGAGEADELVDGFTFHAESDEQRGDERVVGVAGEDLLHTGFGLGAGEVFAGDEFFEGVGDHDCDRSERLPIIAWTAWIQFRSLALFSGKTLTASPHDETKDPASYEPDDQSKQADFCEIGKSECVVATQHETFHDHEQQVEGQRPTKDSDFPDVARLVFGRALVGGSDHGVMSGREEDES